MALYKTKYKNTQSFLCAAASALIAASAPAHAQRGSNGEACDGASINYEDAQISAIVDDIALRTGKKFVIAPQVKGSVTIKSGPSGGLCPGEAWELFQSALRVTGFVATPINGDSYKIVPSQQSARSAGPVGEGQPGDIVTQIVRLRHIEAREAAASLSQISGERGVVNPVRSSNALIIVDSADNIRRMRQVLNRIDKDSRVHKTIALQNASASEVAEVIREFARELGDESGTGGAPVSVVSVDASNSLIIRAEPYAINRILSVVSELDRIGETQSDIAVIRLAHQDAETMATTLRELANAQPPAPGGEGASAAPGGGRQRAVISVDKPTNSIIISGDAGIQQTLRRTILELDRRPAQVLVEAIIVEVAENTARELGVEYLISGSGDGVVPFTTTSFSDSQTNLLGAAASSFLNGSSDTTTTGDDPLGFDNEVLQTALASLLGLNGVAIGGGGKTAEGNIYTAIVTAIQEDQDSNVLSMPSVLTLDNQPARLSVGQEIPITTGESLGDDFTNAFRTVSREEVGVILEVTPRINEGATVTLQIKQETSSVNGQIISSSTDLITNKRVIETVALVDDGDILVVGGLIDQTDEYRDSKVPVLGDIPVAGNLFKTSGRGRDKRSLMVFIKPTIIRDRSTAGSATSKKIDYIKARELMRSGEPVSEMEQLIDQATGVAPARGFETRSILGPSKLKGDVAAEGETEARLAPAKIIRTGETQAQPDLRTGATNSPEATQPSTEAEIVDAERSDEEAPVLLDGVPGAQRTQ